MANLFDFTSIMPGATRASTQSELNPFGASLDITGGVKMAPAPYISGTTQEQATQMETVAKGKMDSENNKMIIQGFIDATKGNPSLSSRREAVKKMIENGEDESFIVDAIQNKMGISPKTAATSVIEEQKQEPGVGSTLKGIGEKTATAFTEGLKSAGEGLSGAARGIGSNIYQMTHGGEKATDIGRPLIEGLIGAGRAVTSPIEGVVSQGIEQVAAPVASAITPEVVKDLAKEGFANAQEWYNSQSEPTKQLIKDTGLTAEGALNILGVKVSPKAAEAALKGAEKVTEAEILAGKSVIEGAKKVAPEIVKGAKAVVKVPSKIAEGGISLATGISKEAQTAIKKAPNAYEAARKGVLTRESQAEKVAEALKTRIDDLSDTGKDYQAVRKGVEVANKAEIEDILAKNAGVVKQVNLPVKDRSAIKQVSDYIAERSDNLTDDDLLSLRHNIDTTIGWQEGVSSKGQGIIRGIRNDIDKLAKERIEGLAKLDAKFAPEKKFLDEVRPLIFNKDGSLKDNYIQAIANITGKGKELKLDRLEKILPGIGDEMRALKAYEEVGSILSMKTGSIGRQLAGASLGGVTGGIPGAIAGYVATNPALYARGLELVGKLGSKNAKKVIPRPLKKSKIISNGKLQSTLKPAVSSKPLQNAKTTEKVPAGNAQVPLKDGASKPKSLQSLMRSKGGFIKLPGKAESVEDGLNILKQDEVKNIRTNPKAKNQYVSGDFKPLSDLDSDALYRAIGTYDFDNIPKQVTLYRGIKSNKDFDLFDGDFLTKNKKIAEDFAGKTGNVKSFRVNTNDLLGSDFGYEEVIYKKSN